MHFTDVCGGHRDFGLLEDQRAVPCPPPCRVVRKVVHDMGQITCKLCIKLHIFWICCNRLQGDNPNTKFYGKLRSDGSCDVDLYSVRYCVVSAG